MRQFQCEGRCNNLLQCSVPVSRFPCCARVRFPLAKVPSCRSTNETKRMVHSCSYKAHQSQCCQCQIGATKLLEAEHGVFLCTVTTLSAGYYCSRALRAGDWEWPGVLSGESALSECTHEPGFPAFLFYVNEHEAQSPLRVEQIKTHARMLPNCCAQGA
jgi:hypothetical protein